MTNNKLNICMFQAKRIPNTFNEGDIGSIFHQILTCDNYWKKKGCAEWGKFFKMRDICIVATMFFIGARPKEACCLRIEDIDFPHSFIKIRGMTNKRNKDRVVPLPSKLAHIYKEYLKFPRMRFWKGSQFMFPSFNSEHICPGTFKRVMREKILKPLGLWSMTGIGKLPKYRSYTLRHSFASNILNKQVERDGSPDLFAIANLLGHADIRATTTYLHTNKKYASYLKELVE